MATATSATTWSTSTAPSLLGADEDSGPGGLALLAQFSSQALQLMASAQGRHVRTMRDGIMAQRRSVGLSKPLVRKMQHLDTAYKVIRHLTSHYVQDVLAELRDELTADPSDDKEESDTSGSTRAGSDQSSEYSEDWSATLSDARENSVQVAAADSTVDPQTVVDSVLVENAVCALVGLLQATVFFDTTFPQPFFTATIVEHAFYDYVMDRDEVSEVDTFDHEAQGFIDNLNCAKHFLDAVHPLDTLD